jgi:hypothetical protein
METAGELYEDGSEAEGPCVFLASFSVPIYGNIIALCNHMWYCRLGRCTTHTMTPAFPSKVYRT